jgi:hypothetical protein
MAYHLKPFRKLTVGSTTELKLKEEEELLDAIS